MDDSLSAHIKGLQETIETLSRQIAYLEEQRATPVGDLDDEKVDRFGSAVSAAHKGSIKSGLCQGLYPVDHQRYQGERKPDSDYRPEDRIIAAGHRLFRRKPAGSIFCTGMAHLIGDCSNSCGPELFEELGRWNEVLKTLEHDDLGPQP